MATPVVNTKNEKMAAKRWWWYYYSQCDHDIALHLNCLHHQCASAAASQTPLLDVNFPRGKNYLDRRCVPATILSNCVSCNIHKRNISATRCGGVSRLSLWMYYPSEIEKLSVLKNLFKSTISRSLTLVCPLKTLLHTMFVTSILNICEQYSLCQLLCEFSFPKQHII